MSSKKATVQPLAILKAAVDAERQAIKSPSAISMAKPSLTSTSTADLSAVSGADIPSKPDASGFESNQAPQPSEGGAMVKTWTGTLAQGAKQISMLVIKLRNKTTNNHKGQSVTQAELDMRLEDVNAFLCYLELTAPVTPKLKEDKIDISLKLLFDNNQFKDYIPKDLASWAATIYTKFESLNWGVGSTLAGSDSNAQPEDELDASTPTVPASRPRSPAGEGVSNVRAPPADHPIWGVNGIMHGLMLKRGTKGTSYLFDPRYITEKREARVFGHNGLNPGDWWPLLRVALFHGAHGHPMSGIYGFESEGTYSIVVSGASGTYDVLDKDNGNTLYYSADNSHDNTDRNRVNVVTVSTKSLQKSIATGKPVRVLRSAGPKKA